MGKRNQFRKRYLVSEGDLFQLYADIREVRNQERREELMADFRQLLRESQEVKLVIKDRRCGNGAV